MTGEFHPAPPELAAQTYSFRGSPGYDGQFYRYVAHAPLVRTDWLTYFDSPRMRYGRILVPVSAWLAAAGQGAFVDAAYIGVVLFWVFLGVYWLGCYAVRRKHHPAWGLAFLLLPATLTSIDRMTVDVALAALCVAFVLYSKERSWGRLYLVLLLAPLVRETGALLLAAQCAHEAAARRWRRATVYATAILPAAAWQVYLWIRVAPAVHAENQSQLLPHWLFRYPVIGIYMELLRPAHYQFTGLLTLAVQCADALALCSFLVLAGAAVWDLRHRPWGAEQWAILASLTLITATSVPSFRNNVYVYARPFSPLIFLASLHLLGRRAKPGLALAPVLLIALRVGVQMAPQAVGIVRGLL